MFSWINKVTTVVINLTMFIWNVAAVFNVASNGLSPVTSGVIGISDIIQRFVHAHKAIFCS